jgi:hypothetical protein
MRDARQGLVFGPPQTFPFAPFATPFLYPSNFAPAAAASALPIPSPISPPVPDLHAGPVSDLPDLPPTHPDDLALGEVRPQIERERERERRERRENQSKTGKEGENERERKLDRPLSRKQRMQSNPLGRRPKASNWTGSRRAPWRKRRGRPRWRK